MTSWAEVVERVLDKGIVIDAWARVSLLGVIDLLTIETRVVVASIPTYLNYSDSFSHSSPIATSVGSVSLPARRADNRQ